MRLLSSNSRLLRVALRGSVSILALAAATMATPAEAAACAWSGGTGLWVSGGSWSCNAIPGAGDNVTIGIVNSAVNIVGTGQSAGTLGLGVNTNLNINSGGSLTLNGPVSNNGAITLSAGGDLVNSGSVVYSGAGTIVLDNSTNYARIYGGTVTFGSGQTVTGSGQIGINQGLVINNGLISAGPGTGLSIDVSGGNGGVGAGNGVGTGGNAGLFNTGTMQANNGTLSFEGGLYENAAGGVIQALAGSTINLNGDSRILNGTLTSVGTGIINAHGTNQYLSSVTLSAGSNLDVNSDNLYLNTTFTNNGTVKVSNNGSLINETGALTISGTGTIQLDNSAGVARIYGGQITFGSGQSVIGSGQLGINQTVITNNNLFSVNSGSGLSIDVSGGNGGVGAGNGVGTSSASGLLNNGVIEATGGSTVGIEGGLYENAAAGVIRAVNGSTINLNGDSRILNGTLTSDATSVINAHGTNQYLTNVTLSAGSNLDVNSDNLYVNTTITNNGTIKLSNSSSLINETGSLAINGTGTIVLDNSAGVARIYGGNITFGAGQTVTGTGQLGVNQTTFTINNVFSANSGTGLSIDVSGGNGGVGVGNGVGTNSASGLLNNSTIQATGGSTLAFEGGLYENAAGGVIQALAGSTINLNGDSRILNGTLTSVGTGIINAHGTNQYLSSVTLSAGSNLDVNSDNLYLNTTFTNNGTVKVSNSGSLINETGALTISGTGTIQLDNSAGVARIYGGQITFGSGQSVIGSGQLGVNQTIITNNNLFSVNSGSGLSIDVSGGNGGVGAGNGVGTSSASGLLNNGVIEATGGSTVGIEGGLYENAAAGVIRAVNGSTINLNGDSRILNGTLTSDATSVINAHGTNQYLTNVTLSAGSNLDVSNSDNLYVNTTITNNGTIKLSNSSSLLNETGVLAINGTGAIVLDNSGGVARIYGGNITLGAGQTVSGSGQLGVNQTIFTNNGVINATVTAGIDIDVSGGNGGVGAGNGVGTSNNAGFLNNGTIQASGGSNLNFAGGLYENSATGALIARTGSSVTFGGDASLYNLQAGGVLNQGSYSSITTGAQSTLDLRSNAANGIVTIGAAAGPNTVVTLSGVNSVIQVTAFGGGGTSTLDSTLTNVAQAGVLQIENGRVFNATGGGGALTNAGLVQLSAGTLGATSYANSGTTIGNGQVTVAINNTGTVEANGGTLNTQAITGPSGTIRTDSGATLSLGGTSSAGLLANNGALALNGNTVLVTSDYQNANFGASNAFNGHAQVTGLGAINAVSATQTLSGAALTGNTLNVGNVRIGGSSSTNLTVTNNGTDTTLRGAVQNTNAPSVALTNANFVIGANGGSNTTTISYTGTTAGSLTGQSLKVVNNFDNVSSATLNLQGNVYQIAVAGGQPASLTLAAQRVGGPASTSALTIANVAPNTANFTESLSSTTSTASPFSVNGGATVTTANLTAGGAGQTVTVGLGTGVSGNFSGTVAISNTSVPVTGSGFTNLALADQTVTVNGKVYAVAVANTSSNNVDFGVVRQGTPGVSGGATVTNGATGALTDNLTTAVGATPGNVTSTGTPTPLAAGQSGAVTFALNTSTAGQVTGGTTLQFASTDADLAPLALLSQGLTFTGTVTQLSIADLFKQSGFGVFSGSGSNYMLDLGDLTADSGSYSSDLGVTNAIALSSFSERLGGSFVGGTGGHFTFNGLSFSGLAGGGSTSGDILSFDTSGAGNGLYNDTFIFNGFSHFDGLNDQNLGPITVSIRANVVGGAIGGVPEPAIWAEMLAGFGLLGAAMRRRRTLRARLSV